MSLLIFIAVIVVLWLLWPRISTMVRVWLMKRLQRQAEDYIRKAAGMPRSDESRRSPRREQPRRPDAQRQRNTYYRRTGESDSSDIMKQYAEDVEFTEIHESSASAGRTADGTEWHESQVSDAEWVEIKTQKNERHDR